ncbi:uncharacterized protein [Battus philenor]|uniref:uncharacterized protein n=1 Tax=Battus philenor TaxID=42288 RepID=UPI0035CF1935
MQSPINTTVTSCCSVVTFNHHLLPTVDWHNKLRFFRFCFRISAQDNLRDFRICELIFTKSGRLPSWRFNHHRTDATSISSLLNAWRSTERICEDVCLSWGVVHLEIEKLQLHSPTDQSTCRRLQGQAPQERMRHVSSTWIQAERCQPD